VNELLLENEVLRADYAALKERYDRLKKIYDELAAELTLLKRGLFGHKREHVDESQQQLAFDLVMDALGRLSGGDESAEEDARQALAALREASKPRDGKKKGHGRRDLSLENLPVEEVVIEPAELKLDGAENLVKIGEDVSEHVDRRPASLVRVRVVRPKYAAKEQEPTTSTTVVQAEMPERPLPKSNAGPGLLAHVLVSKYADHIPLHRQESIFKREGLRLARSTLGDWVQGSTELLGRIVDALWDDAKTQPVVLADATGVLVQALDECKRAHFYVAVVPEHSVLYRFTPKNNGDTVAELFAGFSGKIQVDASSVYHELFRRQPDLVEVGCWAHARRKFFQALDVDKERALIGIGFIGLLYDAHKASMVDEVVDGARRRAACEPILEKMQAWVRAERSVVDEDAPIQRALGYVERQWQPLTRFLDDGTLRLDNNPAERELRREAVGRKNWLFVGSDSGARWNTVAVSLVASCAMFDIEPWAYLRDVLTLLPAWNQRRVLELAPHRWRQTEQQPETQALLARLRLLKPVVNHAAEDAATTSPTS
jgi:transposase